MAAIVVRRLGMDDAAAWWALRLRGLRDHPGAFGSDYELEKERLPEDVRRLFAERNSSPEAVVLGAFDAGGAEAGAGVAASVGAGVLVGCVGCARDQGPKERHRSLIWGMYVAPEARGRGVGRALVEEAVAMARRWPGVEVVRLTVAAANETARALYRACGFIAWGREPRVLKLPDRYVDEEHMVLAL
jgi:ribosomal protein S18 acetylase RimI-like enzyme